MSRWPGACNAASNNSTAPDDCDAIAQKCRSKPPHASLSSKPPHAVAFQRPYPVLILVVRTVQLPAAKKHGKSILRSCVQIDAAVILVLFGVKSHHGLLG